MGSFDLPNLIEALVLGVALAMDAMAVTLSNSLCEPDMPRGKKLAMPVMFAVFQMAMPIAGFFGGTLVAPLIEAYAGIVSLAILGFVGGKMIVEAVRELREPEECPTVRLTYTTIFFEAVATSIDAFIVGVSLAASGGQHRALRRRHRHHDLPVLRRDAPRRPPARRALRSARRGRGRSRPHHHRPEGVSVVASRASASMLSAPLGRCRAGAERSKALPEARRRA